MSTSPKKPIMSLKAFHIIEGIQLFVVAALIILTFNHFFIHSFVPSMSMFPTLRQNEFMIVSKTPVFEHENILLFYPYKEENAEMNRGFGITEDTVFVKRLIGVPGDNIKIENGLLYRNGIVIEQPYQAEEYINYSMAEITLLEDEYWMMGDNRNHSADSHVFGVFHAEQFIGTVKFHTLFPWNKSN
jgi:signal peptidase I, bacterial type